MYHPCDVEALGDFAARVCIDAEKAGGPPVLSVSILDCWALLCSWRPDLCISRALCKFGLCPGFWFGREAGACGMKLHVSRSLATSACLLANKDMEACSVLSPSSSMNTRFVRRA